MPSLQSLFSWPSLLQSKHLTFQFFFKPLEITSQTQAWLWSWDTILIVSHIHFSKGADLAFNGWITLLHCALAFSKARDSIIICLASEFDVILFIGEVNLCKKSVKASYAPCITLVNDSFFFLFLQFCFKHQSCSMA